MPVPDPSTHDDAVVAALEDAGVNAGLAKDPDGIQRDASGRLTAPYAVVWPQHAPAASGPLDDVNGDIQALYLVTYVGGSAGQANWARNKGREQLDDPSNLSVAGRVVDLTGLEPGDVNREEDVEPVQWYAQDFWRIHTTPA